MRPAYGLAAARSALRRPSVGAAGLPAELAGRDDRGARNDLLAGAGGAGGRCGIAEPGGGGEDGAAEGERGERAGDGLSRDPDATDGAQRLRCLDGAAGAVGGGEERGLHGDPRAGWLGRSPASRRTNRATTA